MDGNNGSDSRSGLGGRNGLCSVGPTWRRLQFGVDRFGADYNLASDQLGADYNLASDQLGVDYNL